MLVKLKNTFKLNKDNYFKFKVYGTFALLITIAIFIACFLVADIIRSSRLENQYREIFFSISDNFNRVNINHLSSQNEIHQALDKLDLTNTTRSQKIKELKEIIIKLNKAKYYKRGKNRTIVEINYRVAGVQESLELLMDMEQKYNTAQAEISESDRKDIVNAFTNIYMYMNW